MSVRVGINGFGRIGRSVFRILAGRDDLEVVAINDLYDNDVLAYLLRFDTVMGGFPGEVSADDEFLYVDGRKVTMTAETDPAKIPWRALGVELVVESTGVFRSRAKLEPHLAAGASKVLLTVPAKDEIDRMIVIGVNDGDLRPEDRIVSNASCTTNCLAPVARVLHDAFGVEEGMLTTVHAYTNDQRLSDVPHKDLRRSRAATVNVIPTTTGAARSVGKVLPALKGRLDGISLRVPVPDGSIVDFACRLGARPGVTEINAAMRAAAEGPMKGILQYSEQPLVSTDIIGNPHSAIFDSLSTQAERDGWARVVAWYDNEWGYSSRVVDLLGRLAASGRGAAA
ncbi:MAG: type I glyceraldehyde-3-phosphate dehydrogenase [Thermoanaerobaculia bacterium]|nr:MAG: type I glyceraldehyde-3-phosphate dehydrogenase [Thermoanaerobaculia bacterium]